MKTPLLLGLALLSGLAAAAPAVDTAAESPAFKETASAAVIKDGMGRKEMLRNHYYAKGLAQGRVMRFKSIRKILDEQRSTLDQVYKVSHLYMEDGLLQPAIVVETKGKNERSTDGIQVDHYDTRYRIVYGERFVSEQLNWYTYLVDEEDITDEGVANEPLYEPRDPEEQKVMQKALLAGNEEGVRQAQAEVFARIESLGTLKKGMELYHKLRPQGILSSPQVGYNYTPVSGNATVLTFGNDTRMLTNQAEFNLNPSQYSGYVKVR